MPSVNDAALLYRIVSRLEEHGLPADSYRLYDTVDPNALAAVIESADAGLQVTFVVHGFRVAVFGDGQVVIDSTA